MPSVGTGSVDIRSIISSIVNVIKSRANVVCTAPCDGAILKLHYRFTFFVLIGGFFTVWYQWYHRDVITCVSHFNADTQVRLDYINICLSYPYVEIKEEGNKENPRRRYLLFYRWVTWSFLVLAGIYYIPRKVSKNFENPKCKKLIEEVAAHSFKVEVEQQIIEKIACYMIPNLKTHNGLYIKYVLINILALFIDIFALNYFDFLLQGRFIRYGIEAWPFERDPKGFTDYVSQTFPPFAKCNLNEANELVSKRSELFGCHLTMMELYEKVFLMLWVWLIVLIFLTSAYIVMLFLAFIPKFRELWLRSAKPIFAPERTRTLISKANENMRTGDVYLLYRFKGHLSHAKFYSLLSRLADPKLNDKVKPEDTTLLDTKTFPQGSNSAKGIGIYPSASDTRNRKAPMPPQNVQPPMNPEYIKGLFSNPETLARHGQIAPNDMAQTRPLLSNSKNNTSILIE
ncbi:innexin inx2-like [Hyalella azteca]|uniref:Innexin n=1 Tax=Hyalella azteca TaxID=294128 RepID=A0A8B7NY04_HYAAZ|nr:innexin inx2-like [Hyalella azteca]